MESEKEQTPVTILSGFLGAGKTTLLNHLLRSSPDGRLAVLVNDLGEVNIDASLVRDSVRQVDGPIGGVMELTSGCICCSIQTELLEALQELRRAFKPSHILIEATGVAEPRSILKTLSGGTVDGLRATELFGIANTVTVVDAANLGASLSPSAAGSKRSRVHLLSSDPRRPLEELLMEQIECADVLVLNKTDAVDEAGRKDLAHKLHELNPRAEVVEAAFAEIDVAALMRKRRFDAEATLGGKGREADAQDSGRAHEASCCDDPAHDHDHGHHHQKDYGFETFVFKARRAFDEGRFLRLLRTDLKGVVRAKGCYWTTRCPERQGELSLAGRMLRADYPCDWWHTRVNRGELAPEDLPSAVQKVWDSDTGDRRQELVFIGIGLDRGAIEQQLRACFA